MEGAPAAAKPKGRRRPRAAAAAAAPPAAAAAGPAAAAAAPTEVTEATEHTDAAPAPSLSQRLAKSIKQLSQLGATIKTEEAEEVEQQQRRRRAKEPAPPEAGGETEHGGKQDKEEGEFGEAEGGTVARAARRARGAAAALGRRLSALRPSGELHAPRVGWPAAALLALLLLGGLLAARQARASGARVAALQRQLSSQAEAAQAANGKLERHLAELQRSVQAVGSRQEAAGAALASLQTSCTAQAGAAAELGSQLAEARSDVAQLQAAVAQAAAGAAGGAGGSAAAAAVAAGERRLRQVAREEAAAQLDLWAADRTGLPDWALASAGGAVVAHSPAHSPPPAGGAASRLGALRDRLQGWPPMPAGAVHPLASKLLLSPISQPGACLPLVGAAGWVDVRLARAIAPTAFSYEHIPAAVAHDIRSAPHNLTLLGFLGAPPPPAQGPLHSGEGSQGGAGSLSGAGSAAGGADALGASGALLLGHFAYDARARSSGAVQTFSLDTPPDAAAPAIDHVRLVVGSNHGHAGYTCLYRLRMHGTPVGPAGNSAPERAARQRRLHSSAQAAAPAPETEPVPGPEPSCPQPVNCLVAPCSLEECPAGQVCVNDYCHGSCLAICLDGSAPTPAPAPAPMGR